MKIPILKLPPNRVRRNYKGGAGLDRLQGLAHPADGECPEDWIASLVEARNPGLEERANEGLAEVEVNGARMLLRDLVAQAPDYYLGAAHVRKWGLETGFLAKLLDSSMRLHIQAHPTREFAKRHYGKPWGKFETYVILAVRPECDPYINLGFQHPPTPEEWLRIVTEQDIPAMEACFERVPVAVGQVWYVPGGLPHALGEGLTVLEVMEPSDLVVRCEFEREGIVVPPPARFMGQEPVEALKIFDYTEWPLEQLRATYQVAPKLVAATESYRELRLIGPEQIDCFEVRQLEVRAASRIEPDGRFRLGIVHEGCGAIEIDGERIEVKKGDRFFIAQGIEKIVVVPHNGAPLMVHLCVPGKIA